MSSLEGDKPQVGVHGAEITLCSLLRELYCIGVAVLLDARTILLPRGHGFCPFWLCWTVRGTLSTILCNPLRIRWWQGLQPVLSVSWTLLLLLHDGSSFLDYLCYCAV